jgi:hypothetical protein
LTISVSEIWPDKRGGLPKGGQYRNILLSVYLKSGLIRELIVKYSYNVPL